MLSIDDVTNMLFTETYTAHTGNILYAHGV